MQTKCAVYLVLLSICGTSCQAREVKERGDLVPRLHTIKRTDISQHYVQTKEEDDEKAVEAPLLIGSFNIQTMGKKKFEKPEIMMIIEQVILRYDLILIMEIMTTESQFMTTLLRNVNKFAPAGIVYNMTLSESHPRSKEHCAFLYRTSKLKVVRTESYDDPLKRFFRKPYIVIFISPTLQDMTQFGVIGHHVKPDSAVQELNALADLYDTVKEKYKIEDVLIMGDFNADCNYVKEHDWKSITLWTRPEFAWPIKHNIDTTTNYRSCALDRFVYAGENMNSGVILESAQAFDYQDEYELTTKEVREISDHWPIEIKIRGRTSIVARRYLTSDSCFTVRDSRKRSKFSPSEIKDFAKSINFTTTDVPAGVRLYTTTSDEQKMLQAIDKLRRTMPTVVTLEQAETVKYKLEHGSLEDASSFADISNIKFKVNVLTNEECSELLICRTTSLN